MKNERYELNKNLAQMLKGGVIMDVSNVEQAKIAEAAGAVAVMALERIPADIRAAGGVARMSDPKMNVPFVCGAKDLGEALRRISEGASMIRSKGEAGTGDVIQAVRHMRAITGEMRRIQALNEDELFVLQKQWGVSLDLIKYVHKKGKLPVVLFSAGGVATPADAALMMQLGAEGVFVGSGIFKSGDPKKRAEAIVKAVTNFRDPKVLLQVSRDLGEAMVGLNEDQVKVLMAERGK